MTGQIVTRVQWEFEEPDEWRECAECELCGRGTTEPGNRFAARMAVLDGSRERLERYLIVCSECKALILGAGAFIGTPKT